MKRQAPIVAIDGPSGAGKSTVSLRVAETLGYVHINTGALYRAVALAAHRRGIATDDDRALGLLVKTLNIHLSTVDRKTRVLLDDEDVTAAIRTPEMSAGASAVSARAPVRAGLLELQRRLGGAGGSVLEGRDIGTVVFPDAEVKIFLDATPEERARRRHEELKAAGSTLGLGQVLAQVVARDADDSARDLAPLKPAEDAISLDSTEMTLDAVVARIVLEVERVLS